MKHNTRMITQKKLYSIVFYDIYHIRWSYAQMLTSGHMEQYSI
jgi:hypothetical protein